MEQKEILVQMAIKAWEMQIERTNKFIDSLDDTAIMREIAPGKNRIIYLLGHLVAVNDNINTLLGSNERLFADYYDVFVKNPDRSELPMPDAAKVRHAWKASNAQLSSLFARMSVDEWLSRHTSMTDEDLVREPTRNKLSVLLNRTSHVAYHLGQLKLVKV
jgi:hypothetical protein